MNARLLTNGEGTFVSKRSDPIRGEVVGLMGVLGFAISVIVLRNVNVLPIWQSLILLGGTALPMIVIELFVNRVFRRRSSGLAERSRKTDLSRLIRKIIGFLATLGSIGALYWLIPEYRRPMYASSLAIGIVLLPLILLISVPYFVWVDARQIEPEDSYFKLGASLFGEKPNWGQGELREYILGWGVKAFFLPIMISFLGINVEKLLNNGIAFSTYSEFFLSITTLIFALDVTFGALGYLLTCRILDSQIRAVEMTAFGWVFTLLCYPPFQTVMNDSVYYIKQDRTWQDVLAPYPYLYMSWGLLIVVALLGYVWATICFGCRFSNLTNRGIINFGPYRYFKHPAYLFKCTAWWMMAMPFVSFVSVELIIKGVLLLSAKSAVYFARAMAEERMLMKDVAYQEYCVWIEGHGFFSRAKRFLRLGVQREEESNVFK